MNFWTFKDENSQGYYDPAPQRRITTAHNNSLLLNSIGYLLIQVFKMAGSILSGIFYLFLFLFKFIRKRI